ncbi:MAG: hypothetical protein RL263_322 [Bacteroidota bacterium]|jgi:hypothetical protein
MNHNAMRVFNASLKPEATENEVKSLFISELYFLQSQCGTKFRNSEITGLNWISESEVEKLDTSLQIVRQGLLQEVSMSGAKSFLQ